MKKLYMKVTADKYELPVAISDTPQGLADQLGVTRNTVLAAISHSRKPGRKSVYKKVVIPDNE